MLQHVANMTSRDPQAIWSLIMKPVWYTRNALERDPTSVKAYLRSGLAHLGLDQPETAAAMFKQALQLDATNSAAQVHSVLYIISCRDYTLSHAW